MTSQTAVNGFFLLNSLKSECILVSLSSLSSFTVSQNGKKVFWNFSSNDEEQPRFTANLNKLMVTVGDYDRAMVKKIYNNHLNQKTTLDDFCNISDLKYCYFPLIFIVKLNFFHCINCQFQTELLAVATPKTFAHIWNSEQKQIIFFISKKRFH